MGVWSDRYGKSIQARAVCIGFIKSSKIKKPSRRFSILWEFDLPLCQVGSNSVGAKSTNAFFVSSDVKKVARVSILALSP